MDSLAKPNLIFELFFFFFKVTINQLPLLNVTSYLPLLETIKCFQISPKRLRQLHNQISIKLDYTEEFQIGSHVNSLSSPPYRESRSWCYGNTDRCPGQWRRAARPTCSASPCCCTETGAASRPRKTDSPRRSVSGGIPARSPAAETDCTA